MEESKGTEVSYVEEYDPSDIDYDELDPGIREVVRRLNDAGFTTTDSGDGVSKVDWIANGEALDFPHVHVICTGAEMLDETRRLKDVVESWGVRLAPVGHESVALVDLAEASGEKFGWIQATYDPCDDIAEIMLAGVSDSDLTPAPAVTVVEPCDHRGRLVGWNDDGACSLCGEQLPP